MKMSSEKAEDKALVSVKQRLEDFTRDVSLDRLSDEDALKFLGPSLVNKYTIRSNDLLMMMIGELINHQSILLHLDLDIGYQNGLDLSKFCSIILFLQKWQYKTK